MEWEGEGKSCLCRDYEGKGRLHWPGEAADIEQGGGYGVGVVAEDVAFGEEVSDEALDAHGLDAIDVRLDGDCALSGVAEEHGGGDGGGVDDGVVEDASAGVLVDALDVLGGGEAEALVGLGHEVADEDAGAAGIAECLGDAIDEEICDQRGVEGAWADGDEVGARDGFECFRCGLGVGGVKDEFRDAAFAGADAGFATDEGAVVHAGNEGGVGGGDGVDAASRGEDFGCELNGMTKVAGDFGKGGDEEVAEVVAFHFAAGAEAVAEELGEEVFFFAEGDHAVAEVAGGKHFEVFAEAA